MERPIMGNRPNPPREPPGALGVEVLEHRRTALVALRGELDLVTISQVAEVIGQLDPRDDGLRHVVLDLRGLSFIDVSGLRELINQHEHARTNHHNLAIVRGSPAIERLLALTGVSDRLVLVDDPLDLAPPPHALGR
ncbi:STAS domain-containing protein [Baekduia sp. Peel2402]|uniref:STAS domain-containing protein n=1 Tax=Baekduia sp. Peel2402 TaxID=3458296 RepID=UPI00403EAB3B